MNESERQQFDLFLDGDMPDAEAEALLARLEDDPDAVAYLAERALLHNDLRRSMKRRKLQQWAVATAASDDPPPHAGVVRAMPRYRGSIAAAVGGLVVGFIATSLVWGVMMPRFDVQVRRLLTESFEDPSQELAQRFPSVSGVWNGTEGRIVPRDTAIEGQHVFRFGPAESRRFSYINRIVDVTDLTTTSDDGRRELRLRVAVRPVADAPVARRYRLRLAAFAEDPAGVREQWFAGGGISERALSFASRARDLTLHDWAILEVRMPLPPEARHVVISIAAGAVDATSPPDIADEADDLRLDLVTATSP